MTLEISRAIASRRRQNTLSPNMADLRYLNLCHVTFTFHKLKTFPLINAGNQSGAPIKKLFSLNLPPLRKGHFAAVGTY